MGGLEKRAMSFKSGFIAIIGRPNVGKSTLMNRLLGQKLSIISPKPQTTWSRILGIKTTQEAQLIFLDTPGIHRGEAFFNREMVKTALKAAVEADLILWMIDATEPFTEDDKWILEFLKKTKTPIILAINKADLVDKKSLLPLIAEFHRLLPFLEIVPISATEGENVERLEGLLVKYIPQGPPLFPEDQLTDQPERFIISELIREKVFELCHQEIPYSTFVEVERVREREGEGLVDVLATVFVEKDSQKGIVIGLGGSRLKKIGELARREIERLLGKKVYLGLWVKVRRGWKKDEAALRRLGYMQR